MLGFEASLPSMLMAAPKRMPFVSQQLRITAYVAESRNTVHVLPLLFTIT